MPVYYVIMSIYSALVGYVVLILIWNLFDADNIWEQVVAFFVITPFLLRLFLIK